MIIRRSKRNDGYTLIPRALAEDGRLSIDARGLLVYLLVKPDDWTVNPRDLQLRCGIGRGKTYAILKQLILAGYIKRDQGRDPHGRLSSGSYVVSDLPLPTPAPRDGLRDAAGRYADSRDTADRHTYQELRKPTTKTQPKTKASKDVVVVAPRPAPPDHDDDAGQGISSDVPVQDHETLDAIRCLLAPIKPARLATVLAAVQKAAPTATADDIQDAADDWADRWERIKGHAPDPLQASQLPDVVAAWMTASRTASRAGHGLVPTIER